MLTYLKLFQQVTQSIDSGSATLISLLFSTLSEVLTHNLPGYRFAHWVQLSRRLALHTRDACTLQRVDVDKRRNRAELFFVFHHRSSIILNKTSWKFVPKKKESIYSSVQLPWTLYSICIREWWKRWALFFVQGFWFSCHCFIFVYLYW